MYVYSECPSMRRILGLKGTHVAKFVYICVFVRDMYDYLIDGHIILGISVKYNKMQ